MATGGFYPHFRSERQFLPSLMDDLSLQAMTDPRTGLPEMPSQAFSHDLKYLGDYHAWQEATLTDPGLAKRQVEIRLWATNRVSRLFQFLLQLPGARTSVDIAGLASSVHLIYHALFQDSRNSC